jgi:rfaE bifunctional protein kinase chain/domain
MGHPSDIFDSFSKLNVLIVGDVMIDRYLEGAVSRISPEAPVPVVLLNQSDNRLGGAANVALNVKALGGTAYLCSLVGADEPGNQFLDLLPQNGLSNRYILQSEERKTTVKTRILANSQQLLRVDSEDTQDLSEKETDQFLSTVRDLLDAKDIHVILFQDYNKGVLSRKVINEIMLESIKRDIPTAVDPKFKNFWAYKHVTLFKPNLKEIRAQVANPIDASDLDSLQLAAEEVRSHLGNQLTLITLSEKGLFIDDSGEGHIVPTHPRVIADVCGAGDTVISIAAMGLALKMEAKALATLANLSGGQVCERVGVVPVDLEQLKQEYQVLVGR